MFGIKETFKKVGGLLDETSVSFKEDEAHNLSASFWSKAIQEKVNNLTGLSWGESENTLFTPPLPLM